MRTAVVGHVEWVQFLRVEQLPRAGEIVHVEDFWEEAAGGGPGAASQLLKLAGNCRLFTALGEDDLGRTADARLRALGLQVHFQPRGEATRRALTFVDSLGERTIAVIGTRLNPRAGDPLPWDELGDVDACYFTAGDRDALKQARRSRVLVATSRVLPLLAETHVQLDALVGSSLDPSEAYDHGDLEPVPHLAVLTRGEGGGLYSVRGGAWTPYEAAPLTVPVVDRYGAGDSFAGGLAFGIAAGLDPRAAISLAARCGAGALGGKGPYSGQFDREGIRGLL